MTLTLVSVIVLNWFYFDLVGYAGGTAPAFLLMFALMVAVFVAFLEAITPGAIDNLVIPLFIGGFLHMMGV